MSRPWLVVLGGLPATGKSTVASELNQDGRFCYLRIDSIEQALRDSGEMGLAGVMGAGYFVGYALARDLLRGGHDVLVECVNPIEITRVAWREVAQTCEARLLEVELFCQDQRVHRERAERRTVDIPGLDLPDWQAIQTREYHRWEGADLHIDTSVVSPREAAGTIGTALGDREREAGT